MLIRDVRIAFGDASSFLEEYECSLYSGWIFVPSDGEFEIGEPLDVYLDLDFCSRSVRVLGVVKSCIDRKLAEMLQRPAGAVVEFADGIDALAEMLRDTIEGLAEAHWQRPAARRAARRWVSIGANPGGRALDAEARPGPWSAHGTMLEVAGLDLKVGERIALQMVDPRTGNVVALSANVVEGTAAASDSVAGPPRSSAAPPGARIAPVEARPRAGMTGNLAGLDLPALLQSLASSSARGTMDISRAGLEAHLLFEANRLRYVSLGVLEGAKAVARLLEWPEGEFSFEPIIRDGEPEGALIPIESVLMEAAHQVDELHRLQGALLPHTALLEKTEAGQAFELSEIEAAVLTQLTRPRPPGALLDALADPDADIWRAIFALMDWGLLRVREETGKRRSGLREPRPQPERNA